jgi:transcriptional regulator with PAS, ATPase and Fis domain
MGSKLNPLDQGSTLGSAWTASVAGPRAFIGQSTNIASVKEIAASIASRRSTVIILGETGTGKEMLARHIHYISDRAPKPFVPVDCSSLADSLFESELFGHVKGAFTGAIRDSLGFIRAADSGTLFLDEIGELTAPMQAKLLRVIQERYVVPVGATQPYPVDVRIVCATHRDLTEMVRNGTFRQDLFFRLNVVVLHMPPLRERPADVLPLCRHFLDAQAELYGESAKTIAIPTADVLQAYPWPGNVRELANVIEYSHVLSTGSSIEVSDLPERLRIGSIDPNRSINDLHLLDVERRTIAEALRRTDFNKAAASRMLGINIQKLNRRIERLGIRLPSSP